MSKKQNVSNQKILEAVSKVKEEVSNVKETVNDVVETVHFLKDHTASQVDKLEKRMEKVEALMVTKDYLDEKMADLRGDLVVLMRKEDTKVKSLVDILHKKKIITDNDVTKILRMEPFAQVVY